MPWSSDGFDKKNYSKLMDKYSINGIPTLVVLKEDGETEATMTGESDIEKGPFVAM